MYIATEYGVHPLFKNSSNRGKWPVSWGRRSLVAMAGCNIADARSRAQLSE